MSHIKDEIVIYSYNCDQFIFRNPEGHH